MNQDRNKAWGFTLFGDDIRQEVGGKHSLMGLYQGDMIFHGKMTFPILVPKFVIFILYYELRDALDSDVSFKATMEDDKEPIAEVKLLRKDMPAIKVADSENQEDSERIFHARIPITLTPFVIERPGRLRVRAHYSDGAVLKLGSLQTKLMTTDEFKALAAANAGKKAEPQVN